MPATIQEYREGFAASEANARAYYADAIPTARERGEEIAAGLLATFGGDTHAYAVTMEAYEEHDAEDLDLADELIWSAWRDGVAAAISAFNMGKGGAA